MKHSLPFFLLIVIIFLTTSQVFAQSPFRGYTIRSGTSQIAVFETTNTNQYIQSESFSLPGGVQATGIAFTPDGLKAYVSSNNYRTYVYDLVSKTFVQEIFVGGYYLQSSVAVSPDGKRAYVMVSNYYMAIIDTASNTIIRMLPMPYEVRELTFSPDGTRLYFAGLYPDMLLRGVDTSTFNTIAAVTMVSNGLHVAISPDGARAYVTNNRSDTVTVIDTLTYQELAVIPVGDNPQKLAVKPDGTRVYVTNSDSGTVSVIDTTTNLVIATVLVGGYPLGIAVSPDGTNVYVGNGECDFGGTVIDASMNAPRTVPILGCGIEKIVFPPRELTPTTLISGLINDVTQLNLSQGISNSFDSKLQNAIEALNAEQANQRASAINQLDAFIHSVNAQTGYGKPLSEYQAEMLITKVNQIKTMLTAAS